jgi:hypothetical protein
MNVSKVSAIAFVMVSGSLMGCGSSDVPIGALGHAKQGESTCPQPPADLCRSGEVPTLAGASCEWTCNKATPITCPPVAAPPADFCGTSGTPTLGKKADGCDDWTCAPSTPTVTCPPVAAPPADFCGAAGTPTLGKKADGCDDWTCTPSADACSAVKCDPGSSCKLCPAPGKTVASCIPVGADC